jgi:hypothetical protein
MYEEYEMSVHDIKGAFLLAKVPSEVEIYAKVPKEIMLHWKMMYPHVNKFINNDGSGYFKRYKYLYRLEEAPYHFNKILDTKLKDLGF